MFMLLHTSSSLLRASGYFFPVCYWGATFEMQPWLTGWVDRDISAWLAPAVGVQFPTLSSVHQSIIQPFFFFLSSARGEGRGEISWTFPWFEIQKGRLGLTTLTRPGLIWKPNWFLECTQPAWGWDHSTLWPNVNSPATGEHKKELDFNLYTSIKNQY